MFYQLVQIIKIIEAYILYAFSLFHFSSNSVFIVFTKVLIFDGLEINIGYLSLLICKVLS